MNLTTRVRSSFFKLSVFFVKDVCAKNFHSKPFSKFLLQSDNELLVPEMQKNGGHRLRFRYKACGKLL